MVTTKRSTVALAPAPEGGTAPASGQPAVDGARQVLVALLGSSSGIERANTDTFTDAERAALELLDIDANLAAVQAAIVL